MAYLGVTYRLDPTPQQEAQMLSFAAACRTLWNAALEQRQTAWVRCRKSVSWAQQCREVGDVRAAIPFIAKAPADALHASLKDLDRAFRNWWSGCAKYPNWKSAKRTPPTFRVKVYSRSIRPTGRHAWIPKIGWVRARISRDLPGRPLSATITQRHGHWYICLGCEVHDPPAIVHDGGSVGIDLGIANTVTLSTGEQIQMPTPSADEWRRLRRLQRRLSRRQRGSRGSAKAQRAVGRWHERNGDVRADFIAKTATNLARRFGVIAIEDLAVSRMTRRAVGRGRAAKAGLNRAILARAFRSLRARLEQKTQWTGSRVVAVDPRYTSQTCGHCGHVAKESRESQAVFRCVACQYECHADVNAALNILSRAGLARIDAEGVGSQEGPTLNSEPYTTSKEASYVQ